MLGERVACSARPGACAPRGSRRAPPAGRGRAPPACRSCGSSSRARDSPRRRRPWRCGARGRTRPSRAGAACAGASASSASLDGDHAALAGGDDLARVQREAGQRAERADRAALVASRRSRTRRPRRSSTPCASPSARNASMSAGRPIWCTGMIALVRGGDRALGGRRVEVVGARVDVGEDRRRAALPDRVGGGDERQRRHDHLVAGADARRRTARGAARSCSWSWRRRRAAPTRSANASSKARDPRALGDPAGGDDLGERLGLAAVEVRAWRTGRSITRPPPAASGSKRPSRAVRDHQLDEAAQALLERRPRPRSRAARARRWCRRAGARPC